MPSSKPISTLMAEDEPDNRQMTREACEVGRLSNDLRFVQDGVEWVDSLCHCSQHADAVMSPRRALILLDLNMAKKVGRQAPSEIMADVSLRHIPVIVMTTSQAEEDIPRTCDRGASSYVTKPATFAERMRVITTLGRYWPEIVELPTGEDRGNA
jgi:CheY-like chemotaxis protein